MKLEPENESASHLNERLTTSGLRFTVQRQHVYDVLLQKRDHPTAEEVFFRAKEAMPEISIATVYNCLDTLVKCNLIKQVNLDRGAARYCPNMKEHIHFYCESCDEVFDIDTEGLSDVSNLRLPNGFRLDHVQMSLRGRCPKCASNR